MKVVADWIGYRGTATGIMRDKHIKYAKDILQKELLLYISTEYGAIKKQAELAEPAHKLILWQVNIPENEKHVQDIDKGRIVKLHGHLFCLDQIMIMLLRNPLLILLFCILSKKLTKDEIGRPKKAMQSQAGLSLDEILAKVKDNRKIIQSIEDSSSHYQNVRAKITLENKGIFEWDNIKKDSLVTLKLYNIAFEKYNSWVVGNIKKDSLVSLKLYNITFEKFNIKLYNLKSFEMDSFYSFKLKKLTIKNKFCDKDITSQIIKYLGLNFKILKSKYVNNEIIKKLVQYNLDLDTLNSNLSFLPYLKIFKVKNLNYIQMLI
ncbi:DNA-directed RNA polymerase II subunit RPB2 [Rhizophagus irregularis DAOM 181602=DAOM 197198]|nr:hypothetical protein RhiirB3_448078 [Rhizophagus irregularis]GBC18815.2 DNA-directed RNA polymerase II subunit RPB2 [Rhizophagus irregularis DAOM 181602=DAOM 197198]